MIKGRDVWWEDEMLHAEDQLEQNGTINFPAEEMDAEDPLFILYTSGSSMFFNIKKAKYIFVRQISVGLQGIVLFYMVH